MASPPVLEDPNHASRRAKTRIGVAVVLLAVAIGGLALLSRHKPGSQIEEPQSQKQESVSSGESKPAMPAPETPVQINSAQQEPPLPPAPETPAEPPPPPPPAPVVNQLPPEPRRSASPATPHAVTASPTKPPEKTVAAAAAAKPATAPAQPVTAEKPLTGKPAATSVKAEPAPKAFMVQVGVFTDMENARQLQAKLAEHGIPSHTETKLQVGPFNTKAEADAAQEKLKALGMGAVILPMK
ncbi:MAG TPA: SPOR domain-containing protein [Novimethylophilus sp.]|jgi:DedD protein|uniref:SPOR domain-containing protein n=1 Tax=Novimethylophilus sp. TaxID=2137426 RepID=UPI002F3EB724